MGNNFFTWKYFSQTFTKNLVQADRCGMFLVDETKHEIYSSIFDRGEIDENGKPMFSKQEEIRY